MLKSKLTVASLAIIAAGSLSLSVARAEFNTLAGSWSGTTLDMEDLPDCAAETARLEVSGSTDNYEVEFDFGDAASVDGTYVPGDTDGVYTVKAGLMSRLGLSDESTRDKLIGHDALEWARDLDRGIVFYSTQITKKGGLSVSRLGLAPVDGGLVATLHVDAEDCQIESLNIPLFAQ